MRIGRYFKYLLISILVAFEATALVGFVVSGELNTSPWWSFLFGIVWVPIAGIPASMVLEPTLWAALAIGYSGFGFIAVHYLHSTLVSVFVSVISLAFIAVAAAVIWWVGAPQNLTHRDEGALNYALGGIGVALIFGALAYRNFRVELGKQS
ncbi:MAG: hypothetical protein ACKOWI_07490 [Rhodoluna sp.]